MPTKRTAPAPTDAAQSLAAAKPLDASQCRGFDPSAAVADVWVLVVQPEDGRYRRRVFLSVGPAWRAARRAADRGQPAEVVLCRLDPILRTGGVA